MNRMYLNVTKDQAYDFLAGEYVSFLDPEAYRANSTGITIFFDSKGNIDATRYKQGLSSSNIVIHDITEWNLGDRPEWPVSDDDLTGIKDALINYQSIPDFAEVWNPDLNDFVNTELVYLDELQNYFATSLKDPDCKHVILKARESLEYYFDVISNAWPELPDYVLESFSDSASQLYLNQLTVNGFYFYLL